MSGKLNNYIEGVRTEIKKVNWLSNNELIGSTGVVAVFSIIMSFFLFVTDFGISELISRFLGK